MNKNRHHIIFNAARGQCMVVAENASSGGSGSPAAETAACGMGDLDICKPSLLRSLALHPLTLSVGLALIMGFVFVTLARAQIVAASRVPDDRRPTVLQTANGVPQINIQTPCAAGVTCTTYRLFDVHSYGATLINSRTNSTEFSGFVAPNPWLAIGETRVILNEINSSKPSNFNDYVEAAGRHG